MKTCSKSSLHKCLIHHFYFKLKYLHSYWMDCHETRTSRRWGFLMTFMIFKDCTSISLRIYFLSRFIIRTQGLHTTHKNNAVKTKVFKVFVVTGWPLNRGINRWITTLVKTNVIHFKYPCFCFPVCETWHYFYCQLCYKKIPTTVESYRDR